ncbi:MAG: NifB/NifX family molybdenum-iron cluster-binding protein [Thermodesulfobacteriota bacterium]|nr:NifB/NifX family molybdenum-iron cluster-binding protein [Thermodesulfobacteriota bacterium]
MGQTRIAVVSTDGVNVDEHFGKAKRFLIYELDDHMHLVEERLTETLSVGDRGHAFDPTKFQRISSLLKDCARVYVSQIGDVPAAKLRELGLETVIYKGPIGKIVEKE